MRRGLTFIEVVVALATLSVFGALVLGSIGHLTAMAERNKQRLQGMELAHRVVVQFLDNQELVPEPDQYIWQGDTRYRVEIEETVLDLVASEIQGLSEGAERAFEDVSLQERVQQMHKVKVSVYRWEPSNAFEAEVPVAELTRLYYPFLQDEDWIQEWLLDLIAERTGARPSTDENGDDDDDE